MLRQAREQCQLSSDQIIEDIYPCTPLQEGLMTLTVQQPSSNIVRYVYRLNGQVDVARFKDAWSQTVLHCVNLRTRIVFMDGRMAQVVVRGDACWNFDDHADSVPAIEDERGTSMGYGSQLFRYALVQGTIAISTSSGSCTTASSILGLVILRSRNCTPPITTW